MQVVYSQGLGVSLMCEAACGRSTAGSVKWDPTTGDNKLKYSGGKKVQSSFRKDFYRSSVDNTYFPMSSGMLAHRGPTGTETHKSNFGLACFLGMQTARIPGDVDSATNILNAKCASVHVFTHVLYKYFAANRNGSTVSDMTFNDGDLTWHYYDGIVNSTIPSKDHWYEAYPFYRWSYENGQGGNHLGMNIAPNPSDPWGKVGEAMTRWKGYDALDHEDGSRERHTCKRLNWENDYIYADQKKVSPYWTSPTSEKGNDTTPLEGPGAIVAAVSEHVLSSIYFETYKQLGASTPAIDTWFGLTVTSAAPGGSSKDIQSSDLHVKEPMGFKTGVWAGGSSQGSVPENLTTVRASSTFRIQKEAGARNRRLAYKMSGAETDDWSVIVADAVPRADYAVSYTGRLCQVPSYKNDHLIGAAFMIHNHVCACGFEDGVNDEGPSGWQDTGPSYVESPIGEQGGVVFYWTSALINLYLGPAAWANYVGSLIGLDFKPGYDDSKFLSFTNTPTTAPWAQFQAVSVEKYNDETEEAGSDADKMARKTLVDQLEGGDDE